MDILNREELDGLTISELASYLNDINIINREIFEAMKYIKYKLITEMNLHQSDKLLHTDLEISGKWSPTKFNYNKLSELKLFVGTLIPEDKWNEVYTAPYEEQVIEKHNENYNGTKLRTIEHYGKEVKDIIEQSKSRDLVDVIIKPKIKLEFKQLHHPKTTHNVEEELSERIGLG